MFRDTLAARGKAMPSDFPVLRNIVVAKDRETALREAGPALMRSYQILGQSNLFTQIVGEQSDPPELEELLAGRVILGSPQEVAAELAALRQAVPYNRIIARVQWMGFPQQHVLRSIELLAKEVLPALTD